MEQKERLLELRNAIYNAEDEIDGCFNSKEFNDIPIVNAAYDKLLLLLNENIKLLNCYVED